MVSTDPRIIKKQRTVFLRQCGLEVTEYPQWKQKWNNHRIHARGVTGQESQLDFEDYVTLALKAGLTSVHQIGQTCGKYEVGRKKDQGVYRLGNCRFITMEQNQQERKINGGTAIAIEKAAQKRRGQTKDTDDGILSMSLKHSRCFKVIDPNGKRYLGINLTQFCKDHGLGQAPMHLVCSGTKPQYKDWTGSYVAKTKKRERMLARAIDADGTHWLVLRKRK